MTIFSTQNLVESSQDDEQIYINGLQMISPLDGRAILSCKELSKYFSEDALYRQRIKIQLLNLIFLNERRDFPYIRKLTVQEINLLRDLIDKISLENSIMAAKMDHFGLGDIKPLEHDVKASEYLVKRILSQTSLKDCSELAYFPFTSEDINNIAYNNMIVSSINECWLPSIMNICNWLKENAKKYSKLACLALTHGQPSSPTTIGKRFAEYLNRFTDTLIELDKLILTAKCSGPVGNHNAIHALCPEFDYENYAKNFVNSFEFIYEPMANQRNPHLSNIRLLNLINEINNHLHDFAENMWLYILQGWFKQIPTSNHVGSSVMPQKVNPWRFETAQGYLEISSSLIKGADVGLLQSKFERDLSDHPWERLYGEIIGYSLIGAKYIKKSLEKISINQEQIKKDIEEHPEVLSEAIQIAGRMLGIKDIYEQIKSQVRGKDNIDLEQIHKIILSTIPDNIMREKLLRLTPSSYIGKASELTMNTLTKYEDLLKLIQQKKLLVNLN